MEIEADDRPARPMTAWDRARFLGPSLLPAAATVLDPAMAARAAEQRVRGNSLGAMLIIGAGVAVVGILEIVRRPGPQGLVFILVGLFAIPLLGLLGDAATGARRRAFVDRIAHPSPAAPQAGARIEATAAGLTIGERQAAWDKVQIDLVKTVRGVYRSPPRIVQLRLTFDGASLVLDRWSLDDEGRSLLAIFRAVASRDS